MSPLIRIDVCCNDPDNGVFAGRAERIELPGQLLELCACREPAPRFIETTDGFRLSGKRWLVAQSKEWFGNWCWNAYWLHLPDAVAFICWLQQRRLFNADTGEAQLFELWKWREQLRPEFVGRLLHKAQLAEPAP